ncbi:MAG: outer membrane lipoprotein carrier protein LolA [Pseudomonadota bacterium]
MRSARCLVLSAILWGLASPSLADKLSLGEISAYLNSFTTAEGRFTQLNEDGTTSTGQLVLKRPGRMRFEYDPPAEVLVIADGTRVGIIDGKSNTGPEAYPLHRTPLKIILARNVDFTRARMVTGHASDGTTTTVRAEDPDNPEYGSIELIFSGEPVELRQWVINNAEGGRTTVVLGTLTKDVSVDNDQFEIPGVGVERPER